MAQTSYPFDGQSVTEAQYSQLFREFTETGVAASADSLSLKVSGDGGGMRVFVQAGFAVVRGFAYNSTATEQLTIGASTSQPRIDRVVLRLDPSVNSVVLAVKAGTPATSPVAPTLTQTDTAIYELSLGQVYVGASVSAISAGNVTDERIFNGTENSNWSSTTRPASAREGKLGYNRTTKVWEYWDGVAWKSVVPEMPIGSIIMYGDTAAPTGWHVCDGSAHGSSALQAVIGSANTPDLRSRFIVGAGTGTGLTTYAKGDTGGAESVTLTAAQSGLPAHSHTASSGSTTSSHTHSFSGTTSTAGAHIHSGPYYGNYMIQGSDSANNGVWFVTQTVETLNNTLPSDGNHTHTFSGTTGSGGVGHTHTVTVNSVSAAAASASHENRPPYYALTFIIKKA